MPGLELPDRIRVDVGFGEWGRLMSHEGSWSESKLQLAVLENTNLKVELLNC